MASDFSVIIILLMVIVQNAEVHMSQPAGVGRHRKSVSLRNKGYYMRYRPIRFNVMTLLNHQLFSVIDKPLKDTFGRTYWNFTKKKKECCVKFPSESD